MSETDKVRENRLRRMADRRGLRMEKSRRRDPGALDYGKYRLLDRSTSALVAGDSSYGDGYTLTLDELEDELEGFRHTP